MTVNQSQAMARSLLSPTEIGAALAVHPETIRRLNRAGRIPGYRVGRYLRFDLDEVREALRYPLATLRQPQNKSA